MDFLAKKLILPDGICLENVSFSKWLKIGYKYTEWRFKLISNQVEVVEMSSDIAGQDFGRNIINEVVLDYVK